MKQKFVFVFLVILIVVFRNVSLFAARVLPLENLSEKTPKFVGDSSRNPFLSSQEEQHYKEMRGKILITKGLELSAIFYFPSQSQAIINGKIVKEGDFINSKKVIEINKESVVLKDVMGEYVLRLKNVAEKIVKPDEVKGEK